MKSGDSPDYILLLRGRDMCTVNHAARIEEIASRASRLRRSTRVIDDAVVNVDGIIAAIQAELKAEDEFEFITVRRLLTSATQLLEVAQDEIDRIDAELDCRGEDQPNH